MTRLLGRLETLGGIRLEALRMYGLHFATLGVSLLTSIIIARALGPAQKGLVDLFQVLTVLLVDFGVLGFNSGLLYHQANRGRPLGEVHATALLFSAVAGLLAAVVGWAGLPLWHVVFPNLPDWAILLGFAIAPAAFYRLIWQNITTGANRARLSYVVGLCVAVVTLVGILVLHSIDALTARNVILLTALMVGVYAVLAFGTLYRRGQAFQPRAELAWDSLQFGSVIYIGFLANTVHFKVDQLILNQLLGTQAVGIYAVSVRWAETLFLVDAVLIAASLHAVSSRSVAESYRLTSRLCRTQLLISGGLGLLLAITAFPLLHELYGAAYDGAALPMVLLIPGVVAWSLAKVLSQYIVYKRGRRWLVASFAIAGLAANVPLNYYLIPRWGIVGAGIASMLSYLLVFVLTGVAFIRLSEVATTSYALPGA